MNGNKTKPKVTDPPLASCRGPRGARWPVSPPDGTGFLEFSCHRGLGADSEQGERPQLLQFHHIPHSFQFHQYHLYVLPSRS